jgi:hypothetical protein
MAQQKVLFLAAGQSNAVGQGDSAAAVQCAPQTAWEYRFSTDTLVPLKDPVGYAELHLEAAFTGSAWPAFAQAYHRLTGSTVVMVAAARGGSSCHQLAELANYGTWDTTGRLRLFDSAVVKTQAALRKSGAQLKGIIWSQGERDANAINAGLLTAGAYKQSLRQLVERFRKALGPHLPFYIIQTGYYLNHPQEGFDAVRAAQQALSAEMERVYIVYGATNRFKEKGWMKDEIHYNQTGLNTIGETIAGTIYEKEKDAL